MLLLNSKQELISHLNEILKVDGVQPTAIEGLTFIRSSQPSLRQPVVYQPSIYLVLQGSKKAYLDDEVFHYDAFNYLVLTVPLPIEAHVLHASESEPYLALRLNIDLNMVRELLVDMHCDSTNLQTVKRGMYISPIESGLLNGFSRLITLSDSQDLNHQRILIPMIKKEILYYVLRTKQGELLSTIAQGQRQQAKISQAIHFIQNHIDQPLDVQILAREANMSTSSFHQYFKVVTGLAPVQYIKNLRLHLAKRLLLQGGYSVSEAAFKVGYSSASQFSREYKRLFQMSPSKSLVNCA